MSTITVIITSTYYLNRSVSTENRIATSRAQLEDPYLKRENQYVNECPQCPLALREETHHVCSAAQAFLCAAIPDTRVDAGTAPTFFFLQ